MEYHYRKGTLMHRVGQLDQMVCVLCTVGGDNDTVLEPRPQDSVALQVRHERRTSGHS